MLIAIGNYIGNSNKGFSSMDPDYQAVLDYATAQGYDLPSDSQQALQNQLVLNLKNGGYWDGLDSFSMFATDGDSDFALIDWIRLTDYTAVNSPTFTTNQGFLGNGTSSYIDTNFVPATDGDNFTQDDAGITFHMYQLGVDAAYVVGQSSIGVDQIRMRVYSTATQNIDGQLNSGAVVPVQGIVSRAIGHFSVDRLSSASFRYQINTSLGNPYNVDSTGLSTNSIWILRITTQYANYGTSYFAIRRGMTESEKNDMNSIVDTYLNSI